MLGGLLFFNFIRYPEITMDIDATREKALRELETADTEDSLAAWHGVYLGRKGEITMILRSLGEKSLNEKKDLGPKAQSLKRDLEAAYVRKEKNLKGAADAHRRIDLTMPGTRPEVGHCHPLMKTISDIRRIFGNMGFATVEGPELETETYNFDKLNFPKNHPARDMQDTLWVSAPKGLLMRTHTSPVQARYMEKNLPPFQIIVPGRVFRNEATDSSHEANFYQFEGLMVGTDVSLGNFKWIIGEFSRQFFEKDVDLRFRPSFFPFTEPSVEIDMRIGNGPWLEMMGGGMVHPNVFEAVGYDPKGVQGFAFGGGLDRWAMAKYGIPDVRLFYGNDARFLRQF